MSETQKGAYKFTNRETGEVKFGLLRKSENGFDIFRTVDGEDVVVENKDMKGELSNHSTYNIERDEEYTGPFPTWDIN